MTHMQLLFSLVDYVNIFYVKYLIQVSTFIFYDPSYFGKIINNILQILKGDVNP